MLARPFESTQVPATVQAVLAARIDRLAPEDKRLLQAAAVIGKDVPYPLLQAIAELPEDALRQGLARLQAAEFLYETSLFPDLEYTFKHALTHEVAYGSLLQERRRALHARIVARHRERSTPTGWRSRSSGSPTTRSAARCGSKAVRYLRQAGVQGRGALGASRGGRRTSSRRSRRSTTCPESRETRELAIDLRFDLRPSLVPLGEMSSVSWSTCRKRKRSPRRWTINGGSARSRPS